MTFLYLTLPILSLLFIAAHFLRYGYYPLVLAALITVGLLFFRHPLARRVVQAVLLAGCIQWMWVAWQLIEERRSIGMPYFRMAVILGAVAAITAAAAFLLETYRVRSWFNASNPTNDIGGAAPTA